jgi:hypothetical protein
MTRNIYDVAKDYYLRAAATSEGREVLSKAIDQDYLFNIYDTGVGFCVRIQNGNLSVMPWTLQEIDWKKDKDKLSRIDVKEDDFRKIFKGQLKPDWVSTPGALPWKRESTWLWLGGRRINRPPLIMLLRIGLEALKEKALENYEL